MTGEEWAKNFNDLHRRYPGFVMPEPERVMRIYYDDLKHISNRVFQGSVRRILELSPKQFPTSGVILAACESVSQDPASPKPPRRFAPNDHGCKLEFERIDIEGTRVNLYRINPYEGFHVLCQGPMIPRCPKCGKNLPPWENPVIRQMMTENPDETECWNAAHKGNLLCYDCERVMGKGGTEQRLLL